MKRGLVIGLFLLTVVLSPIFAQQVYKPAEVASAGDAYVPYQIILDGLFVLKVSVGRDGEVRQIAALRDPGAMLGAAKTSVRSWKFTPASENAKPKPGCMTATFVYRPPYEYGQPAVPPKDFSPVLPPDERDSSERDHCVPVGILSFAYPDYPVNSVASGSVVVQLTVDSSGNVQNVGFLHRMKGFDSLVLDCLGGWRFQPATFNGKPITSKTVIAFVFPMPTPSSVY